MKTNIKLIYFCIFLISVQLLYQISFSSCSSLSLKEQIKQIVAEERRERLLRKSTKKDILPINTKIVTKRHDAQGKILEDKVAPQELSPKSKSTKANPPQTPKIKQSNPTKELENSYHKALKKNIRIKNNIGLDSRIFNFSKNNAKLYRKSARSNRKRKDLLNLTVIKKVSLPKNIHKKASDNEMYYRFKSARTANSTDSANNHEDPKPISNDLLRYFDNEVISPQLIKNSPTKTKANSYYEYYQDDGKNDDESLEVLDGYIEKRKKIHNTFKQPRKTIIIDDSDSDNTAGSDDEELANRKIDFKNLEQEFKEGLNKEDRSSLAGKIQNEKLIRKSFEPDPNEISSDLVNSNDQPKVQLVDISEKSNLIQSFVEKNELLSNKQRRKPTVNGKHVVDIEEEIYPQEGGDSQGSLFKSDLLTKLDDSSQIGIPSNLNRKNIVRFKASVSQENFDPFKEEDLPSQLEGKVLKKQTNIPTLIEVRQNDEYKMVENVTEGNKADISNDHSDLRGFLDNIEEAKLSTRKSHDYRDSRQIKDKNKLNSKFKKKNKLNKRNIKIQNKKLGKAKKEFFVNDKPDLEMEVISKVKVNSENLKANYYVLVKEISHDFATQLKDEVHQLVDKLKFDDAKSFNEFR